MKKIVLFCGAGMSSSLLVLKMRDAAKEVGYDCYIEAFAATNPQYAQDADAVLVGPQIAFRVKELQEKIPCPVQAINDVAYGTMNGGMVLAQARKLMKDE